MIDAFIGFVDMAQSALQNVSGNDLGVDGGIPDVGFHTDRRAYGASCTLPVFMMMCMGIVHE